MDSAHQLVSYLSRVAKQPIEFSNSRATKEIIRGVKLSNRFFVKDDCMVCGKCCSNYNVVYTRSTFEEIMFSTREDFEAENLDYETKFDLIQGIRCKPMEVNGKMINFYSFPKMSRKQTNTFETPKKKCYFMEKRGDRIVCTIHPIRSITCRIPHLRFIYRKNTEMTVLGVGKYPRNFNIGCPITFKNTLDEASVQGRIKDLKTLLSCAEDIGVDTYLPEIIDYLDKGGREPREFTTSRRGRLFVVNQTIQPVLCGEPKQTRRSTP